MSKKLSTNDQMKIAIDYLENSDMSYSLIARKYKITAHQARYSVQKYKNHKFEEQAKREIKTEIEQEKRAVRTEIENEGATNIVNDTITETIAEIRKNTHLQVDEKLQMLNKLTLSMQRIQKMLFVDAIKKPEAKMVIKLCKKIKPNLTDQEIFELWEQIRID